MRTTTIVLAAGLLCSSLIVEAQFGYIAAPLAHRRIASGPDVPSSGSVSPNGRSIAVIDSRGELSIRDLTDGWGELRRLRSNDLSDRIRGVPVWSPDSTRLAISTPARVAVVDVATGVSRTVLSLSAGDDVLPQAWTSDGQQLLTISRKAAASWSLLWIDVLSGSTRAIPLSFIPDALAVSRDGRNIAMSGRANQAQDARLEMHLLTSKGEEGALNQAAGFRAVAWTPDGRHLLAQRGAALWTFEMEANKVREPPLLVTANLGTAFHGIPYVLWMGMTDAGVLYYKNATSTSDIYVADMDFASGHVTSGPAPLPLDRVGFNVLPRWSPDSREILYHRVEWAPADNLVYSTVTRTERRIAASGSAAAMCWAHDGKTIVMTPFVGGDRVYDGIQLFDVSSGVQSQLRSDGPTSVPLSCAGDWVTLASASGVMVHSLSTGSTQQIFTFQRPFATRPMLSHDGRTVAFTAPSDESATALMTIPSTGGMPRELIRLRRPAEFQSNFGIAWSPDDRFIYYLERREGDVFELFRIPLLGGAAEPVGLNGFELRDIDIAPNGKAITFSIGGVDEQVLWAIDFGVGHLAVSR